MLLRVKDFTGLVPAIRDFGRLFGDDYLLGASIDETKNDRPRRQFTFRASDDSVDLDDEIIQTGAFHDLRGVYDRNPVILAGHQHKLDSGLCPVVARTVSLQTKENPVWGVGEFVDTAAGLDHEQAVLGGALKGVSVGFRARETARGPEGRRIITKAALLEISLVPIPANTNALILSYVSGALAGAARSAADPGQTADYGAAVEELRAELDELKAVLAGEVADQLVKSSLRSRGREETFAFDEDEINECLAAVDGKSITSRSTSRAPARPLPVDVEKCSRAILAPLS